MATKDKKPTLKEQMAVHHAKHLERGGRLTKYWCHNCKQWIDTIQPEEKLVSSKGYWDSVTSCTECEGLNFVLTYPSGITKSYKFPGGKNVEPKTYRPK